MILFRALVRAKNCLESYQLFNTSATRTFGIGKLYVSNCHSEVKSTMNLSAVIKILDDIAPLHLAESWDNVGLLVEPSSRRKISSILLTNDLTEKVLDEAVTLDVGMILSYHPPIFTPIKSLKCNKWKDKIIIRCIENGIAIYSPHTAFDAVSGGVNEWLINCFDVSSSMPIKQSSESLLKFTHSIDFSTPANYDMEPFKMIPDTELTIISSSNISQIAKINVNESSFVKVMELFSKSSISSISITKWETAPLSGCGMGRIGQLKRTIQVQEAVAIVKKYLHLNQIRLSLANGHSLESSVTSVAVCAGSGAGVLRGVKADLYLTGEMSHHELLDAAHRGVTVILCEHSNTERGFLNELVNVLQSKLSGVSVLASKEDKDPVMIV